MSEMDNNPNKLGIKRALCYVPIVAIIFSVIEKDNPVIQKDVKYWIMLFAVYFIVSLLGWLLWLRFELFLLYIIGSWFLAFKAYNKEDITIGFLDDIYESINGRKKK